MEHIVEINFNNKRHCDLIILLSKLNKFYVEDLSILVSQKLPTINDIIKDRVKHFEVTLIDVETN